MDTKHFWYRFRLMMSQLKRKNARSEGASAISEQYGQFQQICSDMVAEMEDL